MSNWKNAERQAAKLLGGTRRVRVMYSESCEDVHHTDYAIEVKYGGQVPKWVADVKRPVILNDGLVLFKVGSGYCGWVMDTIYKKCKFIEDGLKQASSYNPTKPALLVMKRRGQRGMVGCMYLTDWTTMDLYATVK